MDNDALTKFVKGKIQSSGFSLESQVEKILKQKFQTIKRETSYYDKDEMKGRSLDIIAEKFFPDVEKFPQNTIRTLAQLSLLVECKNVKGNVWVFSDNNDHDDGFVLPNHSCPKFDHMENDPTIHVLNFFPIEEIPYVSGYDEYVFEVNKSNKKTDNLYSAIMTVTKATSHSKESYDKTSNLMYKLKKNPMSYRLLVTIFQPVIVFTGNMFLTKISESGDLKINRVPYIQMDMDYVSKDYNELTGRIHIVSYENLLEYLELVENHYREYEDFLITNQQSLLQNFDSNPTGHVLGGIKSDNREF